MFNKERIAGLFDLDGVIFDTESIYSDFWKNQGKDFVPDIPDFGEKIKGHTLKEILADYFPEQSRRDEIVHRVNELEANMVFQYIPGVLDFIKELRRNRIKTAVVTSSNDLKMNNIYRSYPDFSSLFDTVVTADKISRSKPDPECYLLAASELDADVRNCFVFEDSFAGLASGRHAGMKVIGLSTTNPYDLIKDKADVVIPNFLGFSLEDLMRLRDSE